MSFTEAQHHEEKSIYDWILKKIEGISCGVKGSERE